MSDKCVCGHLNGQHWFESDAELHPCHICECDDFNAVMFELDPMMTDKLSPEELKQMRIAYSLRYKQRLTALLPSPDALSYQMGYEDAARQPDRLKELEEMVNKAGSVAGVYKLDDEKWRFWDEDSEKEFGPYDTALEAYQALTAQESEQNG